MSDQKHALPGPQTENTASGPGADGRLNELRCSASLMRLDPGLYCVLLSPSADADPKTGLPGVRITASPGPAGRPEAVEVRTIAADGWMSGFGDAALVRVSGSAAYVMVTIYQAPGSTSGGAPNLQVLPLIQGNSGMPGTPALPAPAGTPPLASPSVPTPRVPVDIVAHVQTRGDVGAAFGTWLGERGSGKWIEGFGIAPTNGIELADIEYQVTLGRGWLSPWVDGGQYCGSRGMALPMLGVRVRLRCAAAENFELRYSASFTDGSQTGPVAAGEPCEAESLAPVEALMIEVAPIGMLPAIGTGSV